MPKPVHSDTKHGSLVELVYVVHMCMLWMVSLMDMKDINLITEFNTRIKIDHIWYVVIFNSVSICSFSTDELCDVLVFFFQIH